jgi:succinyl-diaminopimelate desuccinylase
VSADATLDFACELIRRPSVTPADQGCQDLLTRRLGAAGFSTETLQFNEVTNLWARRGNAGPVLCFAGHTDVVPAGDPADWQTKPFEPVVKDGMLFGRGAADMKAALAAMTDAVTEFVAEHPQHRGSIAFLITSDEEGKARDGTARVMRTLAERGEKIDWCVIGEPSCEARLGDTLRVGRRGSLSCELTVRGLAGHVAYPHLARNPIQAFTPVLNQLYGQPLDQGNAYFPPSSFQVVRLQSVGDAVNVTPGVLTTRFNIRYSTEWTYSKLQAWIEELLQRAGLDYSLDWIVAGEPFITSGGPLVSAAKAAVHDVTGIVPELSTGGGTSDGRFIAPYGTHVVEFGALNPTIHKPNECMAVADIARLKAVYRNILKRLLVD